MEAQFYAELGNSEKALETYNQLMEQNQSNAKYYDAIMRLRGYAKKKADAEEKALEVMSEFIAKYPRNAFPIRYVLNFVSGERFAKQTRAYLIFMMTKGAPSAIKDLKSVFRDKSKSDIVEKELEALLKEYRDSGTMEGKERDPSFELFALYFLAQTYDRRGKLEQALSMLGEAIEHTPTMVELYTLKAKILKHLGRLDEASEAFEEARKLDLADRWLNAKSAKY